MKIKYATVYAQETRFPHKSSQYSEPQTRETTPPFSSKNLKKRVEPTLSSKSLLDQYDAEEVLAFP